jgi:two-component system sensor histidine kinase FlrB
MLAFSRGGSFSLSAIRVDDALTVAIAGLQPRLRQLKAELHLDLGEADNCLIAGNRDALAGAFSNLIDNALNHGGEHVNVNISAGIADDDSLLLVFEDDGPGIDPVALPRIFDPFFTTRERGTGLGLAVVQAVVLEHGGALRAVDPARGGARFEIQLPRLKSSRQDQSTSRKQV